MNNIKRHFQQRHVEINKNFFLKSYAIKITQLISELNIQQQIFKRF